MSQLTRDKATICIVNYKTMDFTRLCLRSIRKFTEYPYEMLVVDNDSGDDSTTYLRSLKWIRLIERSHPSGQPRGSFDQAAALDLGLSNCNTEYFIAMHSDTFVKRAGWLTEIIAYFKNNPEIACVGSGKIELTPPWLQILKKYTDFKSLIRNITAPPLHKQQKRYYNRSICCLYRTEVLKKERLSFAASNSEGFTAGQKLYYELVDRGYKTVELPHSVMGKYIVHLAHATQVINPKEFKLRSKTHRKFSRMAGKIINLPVMQQIIDDDSLDS